MKPIIEVAGVSKSYKIGAQRKAYLTLREQLGARLRSVASRLAQRGGKPRLKCTEFWALKDVTFSVAPGEVVGVVGRNGAGKSTLLKILSQITPPSHGAVRMRGRVGSLLEVGTGFHPELTGRENIYLNGAILGMSRAEVRRKFDEIVNFAEIETFLETPVKRYSSGMYVRLAFAVAAHLEPEVLMIDEVLAVGDYEFQKKCLGKMGEVARGGRTVLLVSHNTANLLNLCDRAVLLERGGLVADGPCEAVVSEYLAGRRSNGASARWESMDQAPGGDMVRIQCVSVLSLEGAPTDDVDVAEGCRIEIRYWALTDGNKLNCSIQIINEMGAMVLSSFNAPSAILGQDEWAGKRFQKGLYSTICEIPRDLLNEGRYTVNVFIQRDMNLNVYLASKEDVVAFSTFDSGAMRREYGGVWGGVVRPRLRWLTNRLES